DRDWLEENTTVIFTSDHGGGAAGGDYATSNRPLRGGQGYQYEDGLRVPYCSKLPWLNQQGAAANTPVAGAALARSHYDLGGAALRPAEHQGGLKLVPLLRGDTLAERSLIWHYPHYGNQGGRPSSIIRRGPWKLIHYYSDSSEVLYNVEKGPEERQDVYNQH